MDNFPDEVIEHVLSFLPLPDVLNCSLVNKRWNRLCRSHMKTYRETLARIDSTIDQLFVLNQDFLTSNLDFINGLHVRDVQNTLLQIPQRQVCIMLQNMGMQYLSINMSLDRPYENRYKILQHIVVQNQKTIKTIILFGTCGPTFDELFTFLHGPNEDAVYPAVEEIRFDDIMYLYTATLNTLQTQLFPNLRRLNGEVEIAKKNDFEVKMATYIRRFDLPASRLLLCNRTDDLTNFCNNINKLTSLNFHCLSNRRFDVSRVYDSYLNLVLRNCNTITDLMICRCQLVKLHKYNFMLRFRYVRTLHIMHNTRDIILDDDDRIFRSMLVNTYVFSSLKEVSFSMSLFDNTDSNIFDIRTVIIPTNPHLSIRIRNYSDRRHIITSLGYAVLKIKDLDVHITEFRLSPRFHTSSIFEACPKLKTLTMRLSNYDFTNGRSNYDLDALLCGISVEEAILLQQMYQTGEYDMKSLNIVPIRPCLINMSGLERLELIDYIRLDPVGRRISHLSCFLVFARMKDLQVYVSVDDTNNRYYNPMKGYLTIKKATI